MAPRQVQRKAASSQADTIPVVPRNRNKRKADDLDDEQPSKALKHSDGNVQSKRTVTPKPSDDGTVKPKAARQRKPRARKGAADFKGQKKLSEFFTRTPPATPPPKRVDHDGDVSMTDAPAIDEATLVEEIEAVSPPGTDIPGDQYEGSETGAVPFEEGIDEVKDVTEDVEGLVLEMSGQILGLDNEDKEAINFFSFSILATTCYPQTEGEWKAVHEYVEDLRKQSAAIKITGTRLQSQI